jgi:stage V sporulation protein AC
MKITKKEYEKYVEQKAKKSPLFKNMTMAFLVGGAICTVGQFFMNLYQNAGLSKEEVSAATAITMIFLGAFLTGLNIYDNIAKVAGAGTIVPITGFANSIVSPAMEFKSEGFILGMGAKMFVIAGPVLVFGTAASVIYGLVLYVFRLV